MISGRTGVPVVTVSRFGKNAFAASSPRKTWVQNRLVITFARPGRAFESWMKVFSPSLCPA